MVVHALTVSKSVVIAEIRVHNEDAHRQIDKIVKAVV